MQNAVTEPGLYFDIDAEAYHADPCPAPSLSSGMIQILLSRSPAHAREAHPKLATTLPDEAKDKKLDFGSAAHAMLLGRGRDLQLIFAEDYRTKGAKEAREAAYAEGKIPILAREHQRAAEMVAAARQQIAMIPDVADAFDGSYLNSHSEVVLAWQEGPVWCRGMADRLLIDESGPEPRIVMIDFKTTEASAHPAAVATRIFEMAYDVQATWYRRGLAMLRPDIRQFEFRLVTQEKDPPYALSSVTLAPAAWALAEKKIRAALGIWSNCLAADYWPAYPQITATAELPPWIEARWLEREVADESLVRLAAPFADLMAIQPPPPQRLMEPN